MLDDNEFFRNATLRICGNLEIEEAMSSCASYLQGFMPLDHMFFQLYEPDLGAMRTLATASAEEASKVDLLTPLTKDARDRIRSAARAEPEDVVVID